MYASKPMLAMLKENRVVAVRRGHPQGSRSREVLAAEDQVVRLGEGMRVRHVVAGSQGKPQQLQSVEEPAVGAHERRADLVARAVPAAPDHQPLDSRRAPALVGKDVLRDVPRVAGALRVVHPVDLHLPAGSPLTEIGQLLLQLADTVGHHRLALEEPRVRIDDDVHDERGLFLRVGETRELGDAVGIRGDQVHSLSLRKARICRAARPLCEILSLSTSESSAMVFPRSVRRNNGS